MRALVIVHAKDLERIQDIIIDDGRLSNNVFTFDSCSFELCLFKVESGRPVLTGGDGQEISHDEIAQRCSIIVLIAADYAVNEPEVTKLLSTFLRGERTPDWTNEAAIIVRMADITHSSLQSLPGGRVFFAPPLSAPSTTQGPESARWVHQVKSELDGLIRTIAENQTRNPNVGFGVLLVDNEFNFFLRERLREPGRGTLGTIGGNFERTHDIASELARLLKRRFRHDGQPQMELGPLLACTSMRGDFLHYIDLTFLAVVTHGSTISDVSDEELKPPGDDMIRRLPSRAKKRTPRDMFTLTEVAAFHRKGLLFTPVANAFESLCRLILAQHLLHGRGRIIKVPNLLNEREMLDVDLGPNSNNLRKIVSTMPLSKTAIPFFEGRI